MSSVDASESPSGPAALTERGLEDGHGILAKRQAEELRGYLDAHLAGSVTLDGFTIPAAGLWVPGRPDGETCEDTAKLLAEVAALSDRITLRVHDVSTDPRPAEAEGSSRFTCQPSC